MTRFDLLVVGGGWGGYTAALTLAQAGGRVALVEGDRVGGVCLHRGCIPTKALLEAASVLRLVDRAGDFGVPARRDGLDWPRVQARSDEIVRRLERGMEDGLRLAKVERVAGWATVSGPGAVEVATDGGAVRLESEAILLASGSQPRDLPFLRFDRHRVISSDEALRIDPPARALIVGAGAVGVEFASLWADLGTEVTLLEAEAQLLPQEDADIAAGLADALAARGLVVATGARIDEGSVNVGERSVRLAYETGEGRREAEAEVVLVAVGREPRGEGLGAELAGASLCGGAIAVDPSCQAAPGLFAVGDLTGGVQLAHVAAAQGRYVAQWLAEDPAAAAPDPWGMPRAVYGSPQVAAVGRTEAQAREHGHRVAVGRARYRTNARALIAGEPEGLVTVVVDADSGDVLGVHLLGPQVTETVGGLALGTFLNMSVWELATAVQPHPTLSEVVADAAQSALRRMQRAPAGARAGASK